MPKDWLASVGYTPEDALPLRARPRSRRGRWLGQTSTAWVFALLTNLVAASIGWGFGKAGTAVLRPQAPTIVVTQRSDGERRHLLRIDRTVGFSEAMALTKDRSPELMSLTRHWNDPRGRRRFGHLPSSLKYYSALRRIELDVYYSDFVLDGVGRPSLYEVGIPPSWTNRQLELYVDHWATQCRIDPQMIHVWSSFRNSDFGPLEDECRPDGICLILAENCDNAFSNLGD
jgi:hypothetical protein